MNGQRLANSGIVPIDWVGGVDGYLRLLDQTRLPAQVEYVDCRDVQTVWQAIKSLQVRGAPAIGIAAAYGMLLAIDVALGITEQAQGYRQAADYLSTSRPTAVNLFWALDRMKRVLDGSIAKSHGILPSQLGACLLAEARAIEREDRQMCRHIGELGAELIPKGATLMTHCNAGGLATSGLGTALSVMFTCQDQGNDISVFADETRPLWQGSRLTAWELQSRGIPTTVICDSMAAHVMQTRKIDAVIVGADRITARGDVANKIGTYGLAVSAQFHRVPFYVAAPSNTFDLSLHEGSEIPIEERDPNEIVQPYGVQLAPSDVRVYNPAFDVTPSELITAIITERGVISPVEEDRIREIVAG